MSVGIPESPVKGKGAVLIGIDGMPEQMGEENKMVPPP